MPNITEKNVKKLVSAAAILDNHQIAWREVTTFYWQIPCPETQSIIDFWPTKLTYRIRSTKSDYADPAQKLKNTQDLIPYLIIHGLIKTAEPHNA